MVLEVTMVHMKLLGNIRSLRDTFSKATLTLQREMSIHVLGKNMGDLALCSILTITSENKLTM
jgi:hypothetical protein